MSPLVPEAATTALALVAVEPEEVTPEAPQAPSASVPTRAIAPIVRAGVMIFFRAFIDSSLSCNLGLCFICLALAFCARSKP